MELLSPAGTLEKLKIAVLYGADAVYFAGKTFGLRAFAGNFTEDEMQEGVEFCHAHGKKAYVTVNVLAREDDFDGLKSYLDFLQKINVDAIIVADLGVISFAHEHAPNLEIHVSTQANVLNSYTIRELEKLNVKRVVLARELSLKEIKKVRDKTNSQIEFEAFAHGAMCISYSGRCLLSNYLTKRDANRGACVQACRWKYTIKEVNREDENEIQEDERGTYILNSKDLCMIKHIKEMHDAGICSLKIEGRMKSEYYVASVTNAYRRAIDALDKPNSDIKVLEDELLKTSHRHYTTGFYFGGEETEYLEDSSPIQTAEFMAKVLEDAKDGYALIEMRNRFKVGDTLEVLSPTENFKKQIKIEEMQDEEGNLVFDAKNVQQKLKLKTNINLKAGDILRIQI